MTVVKFLLAVALAFVFVFEALAMLSLVAAVSTNSIPSSEHLATAAGATADLFILLLSGYWSLRLFGIVRKRAN